MTTFVLTPEDLQVPPDGPNLPVDTDGKRECPDCGGRFTVSKNGTLRAHKHDGVTTIPRTPKSPRGKRAGRKPTVVPNSVDKVGTAAVAAGTEWLARQYVARVVPCKPGQVPREVTDIPDAATMVGPIVKFLYPQLPAKAQSLVKAVCDNEDLILAALAWADWGAKVQAFAREAHKQVAAQKQTVDAQPVQVHDEPLYDPINLSKDTTHVRGTPNGVPGSSQQEHVNGLSFDGVEPFIPAG